MLQRGRDYYQLIGVSPGATADEIKQAYRNKACRLHPLVAGSSGRPGEFERLRRAYEVLTNPAERQCYDRLLGLGAQTGRPRFYRRRLERLFDAIVEPLAVPLPAPSRPTAFRRTPHAVLPGPLALRKAG